MMSWLLHLILFWLLPRIALSQCPTGFEEVEHWCILFRPVKDTASGGNADCATRAEGGKIIDLETEEEFQAIMNWLRAGKCLILTTLNYFCLNHGD